MKAVINVIRATAFTVIIFVFLRLVIWGLDRIGIDGIIFLGDLKDQMNPILFWVLFTFFGVAILSVLWLLFKYSSILVMAFLAFICPYRKFAYWSVGILSVYSSGRFLVKYWFLQHKSLDFRDVMFGVILTVACIQLCISLIEGVFYSYKIEDKVDLEIQTEATSQSQLQNC
jgi:hypothetical protein